MTARDPLITAARIRAANEGVRKNPGSDKGGAAMAAQLLAYVTVEEAERDAARLGDCCLAIAAGCERTPQAPCPDPGHPAHVEGVLTAWYALGLAGDPGVAPQGPYKGYGRHERLKRQSPAA